jgi:hypothetical protein
MHSDGEVTQNVEEMQKDQTSETHPLTDSVFGGTVDL